MTRNRSDGLARALGQLATLRPRPPVIMIDNGSTDDTVQRTVTEQPWVVIIRKRRNRGALARNTGVGAARTPYIALCDDDSWWSSDALATAESILDDYPEVAVVVGKVMVGAERRVDPTSEELSVSPLDGAADLPGPSVLGFQACAAVVRKKAFTIPRPTGAVACGRPSSRRGQERGFDSADAASARAGAAGVRPGHPTAASVTRTGPPPAGSSVAATPASGQC